MINRVMLAAFDAALGGLVGLSTPASARVWFGFGFPLFVGPPAGMTGQGRTWGRAT